MGGQSIQWFDMRIKAENERTDHQPRGQTGFRQGSQTTSPYCSPCCGIILRTGHFFSISDAALLSQEDGQISKRVEHLLHNLLYSVPKVVQSTEYLPTWPRALDPNTQRASWPSPSSYLRSTCLRGLPVSATHPSFLCPLRWTMQTCNQVVAAKISLNYELALRLRYPWTFLLREH